MKKIKMKNQNFKLTSRKIHWKRSNKSKALLSDKEEHLLIDKIDSLEREENTVVCLISHSRQHLSIDLVFIRYHLIFNLNVQSVNSNEFHFKREKCEEKKICLSLSHHTPFRLILFKN